MELIDISPPITSKIAIWPGDPGFEQETLMQLPTDTVNLSRVSTTLHLGAHADAPLHYDEKGAPMGAVDLAPYYGSCQVFEVNCERGARVYPKDLMDEIKAPRVLLKTNSYPDPDYFNEDFNSFSPELVSLLAEKGCVLIGIDTPSVDPFESKDLPTHAKLAEHGIRNLEGLYLKDVSPGIYTLIAFPLRLMESDGSPVRAVLARD